MRGVVGSSVGVRMGVSISKGRYKPRVKILVSAEVTFYAYFS